MWVWLARLQNNFSTTQIATDYQSVQQTMHEFGAPWWLRSGPALLRQMRQITGWLVWEAKEWICSDVIWNMVIKMLWKWAKLSLSYICRRVVEGLEKRRKGGEASKYDFTFNIYILVVCLVVLGGCISGYPRSSPDDNQLQSCTTGLQSSGRVSLHVLMMAFILFHNNSMKPSREFHTILH